MISIVLTDRHNINTTIMQVIVSYTFINYDNYSLVDTYFLLGLVDS